MKILLMDPPWYRFQKNANQPYASLGLTYLAAMVRDTHEVAVYNPDLLSKEELLAQFVARCDLLDHLMADLRRRDFEQHQLIVGHRGMGKTTLLRRIRFPPANPWIPESFCRKPQRPVLTC